jgi:hypothetical protein
MLLLAFVICIASFALLAAATSRQQDVLFHRKLAPAQTRTARIALPARAGHSGLLRTAVIPARLQDWSFWR